MNPAEIANLLETNPLPSLVLRADADFAILAANDAYLRATRARREDVLDRPLCEVVEGHATSGNVRNLRDSLEAVRDLGRGDTLAVRTYRVPFSEGRRDERLWRLLNAPVRDHSGEVRYILHHIEDVTDLLHPEQNHTHPGPNEARPLAGGSAEPSHAGPSRELLEREADRPETLESGAQRLRHIIEGAPFAIAMLDRDMRYLFASARWLADYRLGLSSEEIRGRSHYALFPELPERLKEIHRRCLRGEEARHDGEPFVRADGRTEWVRWETRPWRDDAGLIGGLLIYSEDVTAQKRTEADLRRWEYVFQQASWGMALASPDRRLTAVNRAFAEMHGDEPDKWPGRLIDELLDDESMAKFPEWVRTIQETGHVTYESTHVRADGSRFPVLTEVSEFRDDSGQVLFRAASLQDITERRRAEAELRRSEERLRATFENAAVGIAHVAPDGRWLRVNERLCAITGYTRSELLARTFQEITHAEDLEVDLDYARQTLAGEIAAYQIEKRYVHRSGAPIWINLSVSLERDALGQPDYFIAVVEDIDARRRAERERDELLGELKLINADLEARVAARTAEVSDALREREVLLQEVHHRVKNNLQVISSLINLQARHLKDVAALDALDECRLRVSAIALIHEKLYQSPNYAVIRFGDYVKSLVSNVFFAMRVSAERIALATSLEDIVLSVNRAIPCGLILSELITNALKHGFPEDRQGTVRVEVRRLGDDLELEVSDDGVGLRRDFDVARPASLGMQLVGTLVEQLDGVLTIEGGGGTRARVRCPWVAPS